MTTPPILAAARKHLHQSGPVNTCMSNGIERWVREAGIAPIDGLGSCSHGSAQVHSGHNGWKVIPVSQAKPGDVLYWKIAHVSVFDAEDAHGNIRSIGSGTPSSTVNYQPAGGNGYNPRSMFREAWRAPAPKSAAKPKPSVKKVTTKARKNEGLQAIANRSHITLAQIKKLNPNIKGPKYIVQFDQDIRIK